MAWWGPSGPRLIESHLSRDVPGYPEMSHGLVGASGPRLIESHLSRDVPGNPGMSHGLVGALRSQAY